MARFCRRALLLAFAALVLGASCPALWAQPSGELFPAIKIVSGDEIDHMIADYDRLHHIPPSDFLKAAKTKLPPAPKSASASSAAKAVGVTTSNSSLAASAVTDSNTVVSRADYLHKLSDLAAYLEAYLAKAKSIRTAARAEANQGPDSEAFNQHYLRYYPVELNTNRIYAPYVLQYAKSLIFPIAIYRHVYAMADDYTDRAKKVAKAPDVTPEDQAAAEALVKRFGACRKDTLLGAAEGYCLIRQLETSGHIYDVLLQQYPNDPDVAASHNHYVEVRDRPRPAKPPHGPGD